jgi:hypothetical protein
MVDYERGHAAAHRSQHTASISPVHSHSALGMDRGDRLVSVVLVATDDVAILLFVVLVSSS